MRIWSKVASCLLVIASSAVFAACSSSSSLVGKWEQSTPGGAVEFTRDGGVALASGGAFNSGTYQLVNNQIVKMNFEGRSIAWQYKVTGNTMTLFEDGIPATFRRVDSFSALILTTPPPSSAATGTPTAPVTPTKSVEPRPAVTAMKWGTPPSMTIDTNRDYKATIKTNYGDIVVQLFAKDAPMTVNNFVFLSKQGFYTGVKFHRIISGFMIQTGDQQGTGAGGPGYEFADELPPKYSYDPGIVAMANSGPNTNGSQFFICSGTQAKSLDSNPSYTQFGRVISGMDVVTEIQYLPVGKRSIGDTETSTPKVDVYIISVTIE